VGPFLTGDNRQGKYGMCPDTVRCVPILFDALKKALDKFYPELKEVKLHNYKVRVLTAGKGTSARVRVLIESGDEEKRWGTAGVSENIIEASYQALVNSIEYKLLKEEQ
jgi:2-isopropylmalate synthase